MPLVKREIQPVFVSRSLDVIPKGTTNELEFVTNCTLSSIIQQLSNLARHAEDVFAELYTEANFVYRRSSALQERIGRLSVKVTQLDSVNDQDTLEGYMSQTPYHNTFNTGDQVILDNQTLPRALQETRDQCEKVPSLNKLNPYREDGKEALKLYTNPKYFFELWCQDMQNNIEEDKKKREKRKKRRKRANTGKGNKPAKVKTKKDIYKAMEMGAEFIPAKPASNLQGIQSPTSDQENPINNMQNDEPAQGKSSEDQNHSQDTYINQKRQSVKSPDDRRKSHARRRSSGRPRKAPAPPPPGPPAPPPTDYNTYENRISMAAQGQYDNLPLPPEPSNMPIDMPLNDDMPPPPPPPSQYDPPVQTAPNGNINIPPPPPPPPPPPGTNIPAPPPTPPSPGMPNANIPAPPPPPPTGSVTPTAIRIPAPADPAKRVSQAPAPTRQVDSRSELLQAIQRGMNLKKVEVKEKEVRDERTDTVESILRRRIAMEQSSSDEGEYSGSSESDWSS